MNRRHFLRSSLCAAIGASATPFIFNSKQIHAQDSTSTGPYDLIIRGGRVIDPSQHLDAIRDIAIHGGRIMEIGTGPIFQGKMDLSLFPELDASGKIVVPGLLDIHAHYLQDAQGAHIALEDGITGFVDAGSAGADNIDDIVAMARSAPQPARILINIGRQGVIGEGDTFELSLANVEACKAAIASNLDYVVGVKARLTAGVTANDREVLRRAQEAASYFNLPVMIHMGQSETPMSELVKLLKPGDIVVHEPPSTTHATVH